MTPPLIRYNGTILRAANGDLAAAEDCCCGPDADGCSDLCEQCGPDHTTPSAYDLVFENVVTCDTCRFRTDFFPADWKFYSTNIPPAEVTLTWFSPNNCEWRYGIENWISIQGYTDGSCSVPTGDPVDYNLIYRLQNILPGTWEIDVYLTRDSITSGTPLRDFRYFYSSTDSCNDCSIVPTMTNHWTVCEDSRFGHSGTVSGVPVDTCYSCSACTVEHAPPIITAVVEGIINPNIGCNTEGAEWWSSDDLPDPNGIIQLFGSNPYLDWSPRDLSCCTDGQCEWCFTTEPFTRSYYTDVNCTTVDYSEDFVYRYVLRKTSLTGWDFTIEMLQDGTCIQNESDIFYGTNVGSEGLCRTIPIISNDITSWTPSWFFDGEASFSTEC